jgi:glycosyltransferase involved in cell wall biosynthesis
MRILYIAYYYLPVASAATWSTQAITKRLAKNHEVTLLVPNIDYDIKLDSKKVIQEESKNYSRIIRTPKIILPQNLAPILTPLFLFIKGLKMGRKSDMIFCQFQPHHFTYVVGLFLGKILRIPVVARANDVHRDMGVEPSDLSQKINGIRRTMFNVLTERFVKYAQKFLVVCSENREILESRIGKLSNIEVSFNGVDFDEFKECNMDVSRAALGIDQDRKLILFIGRFSGPEYKIEFLLDAFKLIRQKLQESMLLLVGDKLPDNIAEKYKTTSDVRVFGPVDRDEIKRFIAAADVCVGPLGSTRAIPLKVLEYMACGKPVLTGFNSVSKDLAIDKRNIVCVSPESHAVAASCIKILTDEEYAQYLVIHARETASKFSWDRIVSDLNDNIITTVNNYHLDKK